MTRKALAGLTADSVRQLQEYVGLLSSRGVDLGAVAESDRGDLWERHVLDSLRALAALDPSDENAFDLGSGGGLPGIPIAIARPGLRVGLVESQRRRVAWLELVVEQLGLLNAEVIPRRIEDIHGTVDVCFARALAAAGRSWDLARPLLRPGGRLVYFAGRALERDRIASIVPVIEILEPPLDSSGPLVIIGEW
jgi:16S rRNA (guanine527-N7)-methyltransferase